jgi:tRNA pseudouridine13 synthase
MPIDFQQPLPFLTADLPGIGGRIKREPEDFEVEEIPAYEPSGSGSFLYLWVEKRDMGAEYFVRQVARRLGLANGEVGMAGLKDRRAVTRQTISVPDRAESRLSELNGEGIRLLSVGRHSNKLRAGHLRGNRFRILIRGVEPDTVTRLAPIVERLEQLGLPNFYGEQRFGRDGETAKIGFALLTGGEMPAAVGQVNARSPFLRKLALSAMQSALFNEYLKRRLADGLLRRVLAGDVMAKWPAGGMFVASDIAAEQARVDGREIVSAGPIFGKKTFAAQSTAAEREAAVLSETGVAADAFRRFGKLLAGTRRHNWVYVNGLSAAAEPEGVRLDFTLPSGSYATMLVREFTKAAVDDSCERD